MTDIGRQNLILILMVLVVVALAGFWWYTTDNENELNTVTSRLASLESQMSALAVAIQESKLVSDENKQQVQELSNRSAVIARSQDELLTTAVAKAAHAVVSIVISKDVPLLEVEYVNPFGNDPFFRDFGFQVPVFRQSGTERQQVGAGTGFIVRQDGYIVTNRHVVFDTTADYTALLSSGEKKQARVIYRDPENDIALLKIDGNGYSSISFGDSSSLKLGQTVSAIGNALGEYNNSVSVGIISGLDRTIEAQDESGRVETLRGIIQTDAAINRGNSGGPLLDLSGKVIGVNVAIDRGGSNIAFAIPANVVKNMVSRVLP